MAVAGLFGGAALGAGFGELLKTVLNTAAKVVSFTPALTQVTTTLETLDPVIKELEKLNTEMDRPNELMLLVKAMEEGKQLVLKCSKINRLNCFAKVLHEKKLQVLNTSLNWLVNFNLLDQFARDKKETLLHLTKMHSKLEKLHCLEDPTASSSHSTPVPNGNEDEVAPRNKGGIIRGRLSVTVISANNLPVSDFMGKSDPYVVLTLVKENSKAKVEKQTAVVNNSLNPIWNENFVFHVEDGLCDGLIVQVWDRDMFGKDYIGGCTLPLTKVFREGQYNECFELVGASSGCLNLHLNWIPDQNFDDSKNMFMCLNLLHVQESNPVGILKVRFLQAKELTNKHIFRKPDLGVVLYLHPSRDKEEKSKTTKNDLSPVWNEHFEFAVKDVSTEHLIVEVYDSKSLWSPKLIGCAQIRLSELQPGKVKFVWSKLVKDLETLKDHQNRGQVHLELLYCPISIGGDLSVTVISAEDLPVSDYLGKADPYVVLTLKKEKSKDERLGQTKVVKKNLNPFWDQTFNFHIADGLHDMVIFEVWDKDKFTKDDYIGRCILSLTMVILEGEYTKRFKLDDAKSGYLNLHLKWTPQY